MRLRGWKSAAAVMVLGVAGATMTTPYPARAYVFLQEFERSSRGAKQVSLWERVVYSLIEANDRGADCRAPRTT
jgi:hypothetical protein